MDAPRDGRILLAFSGGPDSLGLASEAARNGWDAVLGYADHRLRGARASRDERRAVCEAARALGLPLMRTRLSVPGGGEGAARRARYAALQALALRAGCCAIATAHTADDRAETVLLNLLRGTGLRGLASLRPRAVVGGFPRLRPALDERRATLRARALPGVRAADDASNRSTAHARVRVRSLLLPRLAHSLGADPVPLLCALADAAGAVRAALESRAETLVPDRARLLDEPDASFPYLVEAMRRRGGAGGPPLTRAAYASLREFLAAGRTGRALRTPGKETWRIGRGGSVEVDATPPARAPSP